MKSWRLLSTFIFLFAACVFLLPNASADKWNKKTKVTFAQPVEIPGNITLPAGTYTFRLADLQTDRSVVQILNEDETQIFASILAIRHQHAEASEEAIIGFDERPRGAPQAVREWFYPGERWGREFVYPKERAVQLAAESKEPVLAMPTELAPEITKPALIEELGKAPVTTVTPVKPLLAEAEQPKELPRTATTLPEILVLGLVFMGLGATVRLVRKITA